MTDDLKALVETYQPSAATKSAMSEVSLIATVGPSGSGKSTIIKTLANSDPEFHFVVGETSRSPRPDERDGVDLHFRTQAEILADLRNGKLTQAVRGPNGDLYCTRTDNFSRTGYNLFPLIPLGVRQFRDLPLKFFAAAFIVPATFELWQSWLKKQAQNSNWTKEKLAGRLAEAKLSYEFALKDTQIGFVLNDEINKSAKRLAQLARQQPVDDQQRAKEIAHDNYDKLLKLLN